MEKSINEEMKSVVENILEDYKQQRPIDKMNLYSRPDKGTVINILKNTIKIIFPAYYSNTSYSIYNNSYRISVLIEDVMYKLAEQIDIAYHSAKCFPDCSKEEISKKSRNTTLMFLKKIPQIRDFVNSDLEATFVGDPAAESKEDIILSYPGLIASTTNRIAHELFILHVPLIPRMMTEYAHSITGIDIHPGATIGKYLMMDHGTGIVIGSTSIIGEHAKIYQGVTIGALSTKKGQALRGNKRHPTIEDNVTIYAGASILGGETIIGHDSVIGSNAFITESISPYTKVTIKTQELRFKKGK